MLLAFLAIIIITELKKQEELKIQKKLYDDAFEYCSSMYENGIIKEKINLKDVQNCLNKIKKVKNKNKVDNLLTNANNSKDYIVLKEKINSYYKNNVLDYTITQKDIDELYNECDKLDPSYKDIAKNKIDNVKSEYDIITQATKCVDELFKNEEKTEMKEDINREKYNEAKKLVENLKQEELKEKLNNYLKIIDDTLNTIEEEKRRLEEEKRKQIEKINNAWIKLDIPYISQNKSGVYNGCEAASLLMALKYKGLLQNMDLVTYSNDIPKSDDPNTGFYLSIFEKEPSDVAHWIAPTPLAEFGKSSSGYNNIINATGWNLSDLDNEVINGNPVIIYLTFDFESPINWSNGAPKNLHVLLIKGYNTITGEHLLLDPWFHNNGKYEFYLSKSKVESIYNDVGKKAVVVR